MTFPRFRRFLSPRLAPEAVAVVWEPDSPAGPSPGGLALGYVPPGSRFGDGQLLSIFLRPGHRGMGHGSRLLGDLEQAMLERGCSGLETVYMTSLPCLAAFEGVLQARAWSVPVHRMRVFRTETARLRGAAWMPLFQTLPDGYAIQPWNTLTPPQREELRLDRAEATWPPDVDPFLYEGLGIDGSPSEPGLSFACLQGTRVVGWHLSHRLGPSKVRFSCSYIRPEVQVHVPLLALWNRAFRTLPEGLNTEVSWAISARHEAMERFTQRLLGPYLTQVEETRGARKPLGSAPASGEEARG